MTADSDLMLTADGMRQSSGVTNMMSAGSLQLPTGAFADARDPEAFNGDAIETLNSLLESCRDGEYGFRECAEQAQSHGVKTLLNQRASDCQAAAAELHQLIVQMGGEPEAGGTASEALHRGWVAIKGTLSGYSDYDMLDECERAEDVALGRYRKALDQSLPLSAKALVERQARGVRLNHDQIKVMRDAHKVNR